MGHARALPAPGSVALRLFLVLLLVACPVHAQLLSRPYVLERQDYAVPPLSINGNPASLKYWRGYQAKIISTKYDEQGKVFEFTSRHNPYGFRITNKPAPAVPWDHHIFLTGCSWTYGTGLEVEAIFAAHLEEKLPNYRVTNMAARGASPAEALYLWKNFDWQKVYPEPSGVHIYTVFSGHLGRLQRTWQYLNWGHEESPVFDADLQTSKPSKEFWDFQWAKLINKLGLDYWWLRMTSHFMSTDPTELNGPMVRYLLAIKGEYLERYPRGRFIVSWMHHAHPGHNPEDTPSFTAALEKVGIEYWQPPAKLSRPREEYSLIRDGHPSALAHKEYAEFLLEKMSIH